jgi:RNA polymerase primary sigma factor
MRQLVISKSITNRGEASLDRYLADIAKEGLISAEEEVELARKIKEGDLDALEKLTKTNLRFVVSVAKQYQNQGIGLQDLINEGNLGLIKAAVRFDETRGFKFISFAVWWIRQAILQAIADQSRIVRLPQNQVGTINKIKKEVARLEQSLQRPPTPEEVSKAIDLPVDKVMELMRLNSHAQSMDATVSPDEETKFIDTFISENEIRTDSTLMQESLSKEVENVLSILPEAERNILKLFFGVGVAHEYTLDEIADHYQISREKVKQVKERALKRLRQEARNNKIRSANFVAGLF